MDKNKPEKENHIVRELDETEYINQINLSDLNVAINITTSDRTININDLMDKALDIFLKVKGEGDGKKECQ